MDAPLCQRVLDIGALRELLDYNVLTRMIGAPESIYPLPPRCFGRDAHLEMIAAFQTNIVCGGNEIMDRLIDGDRAAVMRKATFIHIGSGRSAVIHCAEWLRFRKGRIVEVAYLNDTGAMRKLLDGE